MASFTLCASVKPLWRQLSTCCCLPSTSAAAAWLARGRADASLAAVAAMAPTTTATGNAARPPAAAVPGVAAKVDLMSAKAGTPAALPMAALAAAAPSEAPSPFCVTVHADPQAAATPLRAWWASWAAALDGGARQSPTRPTLALAPVQPVRLCRTLAVDTT